MKLLCRLERKGAGRLYGWQVPREETFKTSKTLQLAGFRDGDFQRKRLPDKASTIRALYH